MLILKHNEDRKKINSIDSEMFATRIHSFIYLSLLEVLVFYRTLD